MHKRALTLPNKSPALEEISHGIKVNMVAPGGTQDAGTLPEEGRVSVGSIPLGRVEIEEVVEAVMYFLSDNAGSVTGQCIGVNEGLSTWLHVQVTCGWSPCSPCATPYGLNPFSDLTVEECSYCSIGEGGPRASVKGVPARQGHPSLVSGMRHTPKE